LSSVLCTLLTNIWLMTSAFSISWATDPPRPYMIVQGDEANLSARIAAVKDLGNDQLITARRGSSREKHNLQEFLFQSAGSGSFDLSDKSPFDIGRMTPDELAPLKFDYNHDLVVDEKDLAVAPVKPAREAALGSLGVQHILCLCIGFSDYKLDAATVQPVMQKSLFEPNDKPGPYPGLSEFYRRSSFGQLTLSGNVFVYNSPKKRSEVKDLSKDALQTSDYNIMNRLVTDALSVYTKDGAHTLETFDNQVDGQKNVDYLVVFWAGPSGNWGTFWWGYNFNPTKLTYGAYTFSDYSWQPLGGSDFDPSTIIHETGHALGLPDYYDYDDCSDATPDKGPEGGVGGLDIMGGWSGEHCCFSKYWLGWLDSKKLKAEPTVLTIDGSTTTLASSSTLPGSIAAGTSIIFMPGFKTWDFQSKTEFFMAEYRKKDGLDFSLPGSGILVWHIDLYGDANNQDRLHLLLQLCEPNGTNNFPSCQYGTATDFFRKDQYIGPSTNPSTDSLHLDPAATGITLTVGNLTSSGYQVKLNTKPQ